ncbi:unnamed protein product [Aphanomyces euteiches]
MTNIPKTMRAVGFHEPLPIDNPSSLLDLVIDVPTIAGREVLVQIKAIAVNPVDYKLRREPGEFTAPKVLGFDAAGVVVAVGPDATLFKDSTFYRPGVSKKGPTVTSPTKKSVLILNGSGGVGSIAIQLLKELTDVTVIASASRPESSAWVMDLGADHVVNHKDDIPKQLKAIGIP